MRHRHGRRARLSGVLLAALGALALLALPSVAAAKDRNHDRIPDRWEHRHHLSLRVNQAVRDQDRDNRGEFRAGDNPRDNDSDDDGVMDGEENAGTIASFDAASGRLTITLFGGDTVSGVVTDETEIGCDHERQGHEAGDDSSASASRDGEDGDNSGPGSGEEEDHSGPGSGQMLPPAGDDENDDPAGHEGVPGANEGPGPDGNDDNQVAGCTTSALVGGATVEEAELKLRDGVATFTEVELEQNAADSVGGS